MKLLSGLLFVSLLIINTGNCFADEKTDKENDIILNGDFDTSGVILIDLRSRYEEKGKEAIEPAVPALVERAIKVIDDSEKSGGFEEAEGEYLYKLLDLLSVSGDMRAKNVLLKAMACPNVGGKRLSNGLFNLGPKILPDIMEYLDSKNIYTKMKTIATLSHIYEIDTDKTFYSNKKKNEIKEKLLPFLSDKHELIRFYAVKALGNFGDNSVIPLLEEVKRNDNGNGTFRIRETAEESISRLMEK